MFEKSFYFWKLIGLTLLLVACGGSEGQALETFGGPLAFTETERQLNAFDELYVAINDGYLYDDFGGVLWQTLALNTRDRVANGLSDDEYHETVIDLLDNLPSGTTGYRTRDQRIALELSQSGVYEGVGAYVGMRQEPVPHVVILAIIPGSPAEDAGLRAHDGVYAINGTSVPEGAELSDMVQLMRGTSGSTVTFSVKSPGEEIRDIEIERTRLVASGQIHSALLDSGFYHMLFPVAVDENDLLNNLSFVLQAIQESETPSGLILDLRISHSGPGWPRDFMVNLFGAGEMGEFYDREDSLPLEQPGYDEYDSQSVPLVVLIGADTSGSPEIFAAAMQTIGRATVIGQTSAGEVIGFEQIRLADGSQLMYATSSFRTLDGRDLGLGGLTPDIIVVNDWDTITEEYDPVLRAAEDYLRNLLE